MARIGIDAIHLSTTGKGISRFQHGFLTELAGTSTPHEYVVFVDAAQVLPSLPASSAITYVKVRRSFALQWEQVQLRRLCSQHGIQLLQTWSDRIPLALNIPVVLYTFELPKHRHAISRTHTTVYTRLSNLITERCFPLSLAGAARVVVSSEATRRALMREHHLARERVNVVYPGTGRTFGPPPATFDAAAFRAGLNARDGYVLHFSAFNDPRDNSGAALRSFAAVAARIPMDLKIVIAGRQPADMAELGALVRELRLEDRIIMPGYVDDSTLVKLYWAAGAYLDTSLYEGFGFQVLEALACGTPVVCSNVTSLPEIVENAGRMRSPTDVGGFADDLTSVLTNRTLAATLRDQGYARALCFSWTDFVAQMLNEYSAVV